MPPARGLERQYDGPGRRTCCDHCDHDGILLVTHTRPCPSCPRGTPAGRPPRVVPV